MVITTIDSQKSAKIMAKLLLERSLAKCIQINPITSFYEWDGNTEESAEYRMVIKTKISLEDEVYKVIKQHHDYDTPQIIRVDIDGGSKTYLDWIRGI